MNSKSTNIVLCFDVFFRQRRRPFHCGFLEHWNSQKSLCNIWQRFSCLLDESIEKKCKKKNFHGGLFFKSTLSILRCTWTGRTNLKILLGYNINYLNIWPFMRHPWFPTRKASKLKFICLQLQLLNTIQGLLGLDLKIDHHYLQQHGEKEAQQNRKSFAETL